MCVIAWQAAALIQCGVWDNGVMGGCGVLGDTAQQAAALAGYGVVGWVMGGMEVLGAVGVLRGI